MAVISYLQWSNWVLAFDCIRTWSICGHQWIPTATVFALSMFSPAIDIVSITLRVWCMALTPSSVWKLPLLDWIRCPFEVGTIGWMLGNNRWHAICIVSGCHWNRVVTNTRLSCMCLIDPASPHWHDESSRSHHQDNICGRRCYRVRLHTLEDVSRVQDGQTNKEYC